MGKRFGVQGLFSMFRHFFALGLLQNKTCQCGT